MAGFGAKVRGLLRRPGGDAPADIYSEMRSAVLALDPASLEPGPDEPWSAVSVALMEIGIEAATVTILAVADGSVSMYTSVGGGVIGAGDHIAVRAAAGRFRTVAADHSGQLRRTAEFPLPGPGEVRFHVRSRDDSFTGVARESELRTSRHPLSALYAAGQDLLTEIRLASPD